MDVMVTYHASFAAFQCIIKALVLPVNRGDNMHETEKEIYFYLRQKGLNEKSAFYFSMHPDKFKAEMINDPQIMEAGYAII